MDKYQNQRPLHLLCKKAGFGAKKWDFSKNPGFQPPTDKKPGFRWAPTVCTLKSRFFAICFRKKTGFCAKNRDFVQKSWISEMSEIPLFCNSNCPWAPTVKSMKNDPEILFFLLKSRFFAEIPLFCTKSSFFAKLDEEGPEC